MGTSLGWQFLKRRQPQCLSISRAFYVGHGPVVQIRDSLNSNLCEMRQCLSREGYNYYLQSLYDRILGSSLRLNTPSIILPPSGSLHSLRSFSKFAWEARSKNKISFQSAGFLFSWEWNGDIKKNMQLSKDKDTDIWCQWRLLGRNHPAKLENI